MSDRTKGLLNISANFEVQSAEGLDSRCRVKTRASLILLDTWKSTDNNAYTYVGMLVTVYEDTELNNGVYRLKDSDYTIMDNWKKVSGDPFGNSGELQLNSGGTLYSTSSLTYDFDNSILYVPSLNIKNINSGSTATDILVRKTDGSVESRTVGSIIGTEPDTGKTWLEPVDGFIAFTSCNNDDIVLRYIANITASGWTINNIYQCNGDGSGWVETIVSDGDTVVNNSDNTIYIYDSISGWTTSTEPVPLWSLTGSSIYNTNLDTVYIARKTPISTLSYYRLQVGGGILSTGHMIAGNMVINASNSSIYKGAYYSASIRYTTLSGLGGYSLDLHGGGSGKTGQIRLFTSNVERINITSGGTINLSGTSINIVNTPNTNNTATTVLVRNVDGSINLRDASTILTTALTWSAIYNTPTTLSGYGITDAYTTAQTNALYVYKTGDTMTGNLTLPGLSSTTISASTIYSNYINNINGITALTYYGDGSHLTGLVATLSGLTDVSLNTLLSGNTIIFSGGNWKNGMYEWQYIIETPTTISGYGITDAVLLSTYNTYTSNTYNTLTSITYNFDYHTSLTGSSNPHQTSFFDLTNTAHTHLKSMITDFVEGDYVHMTGNESISGNKTFSNNVTVSGNFYVSGTATTIYAENLSVRDNLITINSGETNSGVTIGYAGIEVDRGQLTNYIFIFDETQQNFRVGQTESQTANTQAVATREDSPSNSGVAFWNASQYRFDTSNNLTWNGSNLNIIGSVSASTIYANIVGNVDWSSIQNTPTTISGYGILDAYTTAQTNSNFLSANTFSTTINTNGVNNTGNITASTYYGDGSNLTGLVATLSGLTDVTLNTLVTGNTMIYSGNTWINTNQPWEYIVNTPTTIGGYSIIDAVLLSSYNSYTSNTYNTLTSITYNFNYFTGVTAPNTYVNVTGDVMTGDLTISTLSGTSTLRAAYLNSAGTLIIGDEIGDLYITSTTIITALQVESNWNNTIFIGTTDLSSLSKGQKYISSSYTYEFVDNIMYRNYAEINTTGNTFFSTNYYTKSETNINFVSSSTYNTYTGTTVPSLIQGINDNLTAHTSLTGSSNPHIISFFDLNSTAHTHLWTDIDNRFVYTNLSSNTIIDSFSTSLTDGCHWNYVVKDGVNVEAGTVIGVWDLDTSASTYTQYSTDSLGNTNGITFNIQITNDNVNLLTNITSGNWNIKLRRLSI